jgi:hypothetical protein
MRIMRCLVFVLVLVLGCKSRQPAEAKASATPVTTPEAKPSPRPEKRAANPTVALLDESYDLAKKLGGEERSYYLVSHCKASIHVRPPQDAARYCREALKAAELVKGDCVRQRLKLKSIELLSEVEPEEALHDLTTLPYVPCPVDPSSIR